MALDFLDESIDLIDYLWEDAEKIKESRGNLGEEMPVFVYRLFEYSMKSVLKKEYGKQRADELFRMCGDRAGREFAKNALDLSLPVDNFFAHLQEVLKNSKIGVLRIERFDPATGHAVITVSEDLDCSGLPVVGETVCNYDEGFIAGILKEYTKQDYIVVEIDCWATGARVCRFDATIKAQS